jgi:hypothetical protein
LKHQKLITLLKYIYILADVTYNKHTDVENRNAVTTSCFRSSEETTTNNRQEQRQNNREEQRLL